MTFGDLARRPDLSPLFGSLTTEENEALLDRLLAIDSQLAKLAEHASGHVGVPYEVCTLALSIRPDGGSAGIHGGPSGDAGDIWFDISPAGDAVGDGLSGRRGSSSPDWLCSAPTPLSREAKRTRMISRFFRLRPTRQLPFWRSSNPTLRRCGRRSAGILANGIR